MNALPGLQTPLHPAQESTEYAFSEAAEARQHYPGGVQALARETTADAACADEDLLALTFDDADAVEDYLAELETYGLRHLRSDMAVDAVIATAHLGPVSACGWAEYGQVLIDGDPAQRVSVCAMPGTDMHALQVPAGWRYRGSRTARDAE